MHTSVGLAVIIVVLVLIYREIIVPRMNRPKKDPPVVRLKNPIDLRYKYEKRILRGRRIAATSLKEQKKIKEAFLKIYPDNLFYDDLNEENSITSEEEPVALLKLNHPISLRHIYKKNFWGDRIQADTTDFEQRQLKKYILMIYPDSVFCDSLNEGNSVKPKKKAAKRRGESSSTGFWDYMIAGAALDYLSDDDRDDNFDRDDDVDPDNDYDSGDDSGSDVDAGGDVDD